MSEIENQPNDILHAYQEFWRLPQSFLPGQSFAEHFAATGQSLVTAQLAFIRAAMGMNAKMFEIWFTRSEDASPIHVAEDEAIRNRKAA